ncbi:hypothetical protein JCM11251_003138 [Rhodosporidiobolus azoricus]
MATFAAKSFDAAAYARARPTYPQQLFRHVLSAVAPPPPTTSPPKPRTLLDLGCGPGLSTFDWSPLLPHRFDRVIGIDPSPGMVNTARSIFAEKRAKGELGEGGKADWRFEVARADSLEGVVEDESVDLAIAGQAAHWFDAEKTYKELARVLKPGGAFAFWGYGEMFFPDRPELTALVSPYSSGTLGPYWEQPGRSIVEALLSPIPFPSSASSATEETTPHDRTSPSSTTSSRSPAETQSTSTDDLLKHAFDEESYRRLFFLRPGGGPPPLSGARPAPHHGDGQSSSPSVTNPSAEIEIHHTLLLRREWDLSAIHAYLKTWSAAHSFNKAHSSEVTPNEGASGPGSSNGSAAARSGEEGMQRRDCTEVFCEDLVQAGLGKEEKVEVAWELGIMVGRKKA